MSPASSFSLVARDLARVRGGLDRARRRRRLRRAAHPSRCRRTERRRERRRCCGSSPASIAPTGERVTRTPPNARVGYLPQEPERSSARDDARLPGAAHRRAQRPSAELERTAAALATQAADTDDAYTRALDDYLAAGGPDFEARARVTCADLGLPESLLHAPTATLSGGQAARASLAAILVSRFDVYLLDEPTNDLDFAGLARLERFLDELAGGVVVVSHDRTFLERVVHAVLELDEHDHSSTEFGGGWLGYLEARATARRHAEEEYAVYTAQRTRLEARARTQRQWAVDGVRTAKTRAPDHDKAQRDFRINSSERQASKAARPSRRSRGSRRSTSHGRDGTCASRSPTRRGAVTSSCASRAR